MELWKAEVEKYNGKIISFVSERALVKEFLEYEMRDGVHGCVWVNREGKEVFNIGNVRWIFYRIGDSNRWKWERFVEQLELF